LDSSGPHHIPHEGKHNDCTVFLTGIGGELQSLIYGYFGGGIFGKDLPRIGLCQSEAPEGAQKTATETTSRKAN